MSVEMVKLMVPICIGKLAVAKLWSMCVRRNPQWVGKICGEVAAEANTLSCFLSLCAGLLMCLCVLSKTSKLSVMCKGVILSFSWWE